ncbi:MAG: alkaline phosphatase [Bacteroidales bacterium]|nr:alkaline phosphatase [Bacteroidales bacterium]
MMKKYLIFLCVLIIFSCNKEKNIKYEPVIIENDNSKPKNIIFLIGDGMGLSQITGAMTVNNDEINMSKCKYIGLTKTSSADEYVTDSGASGTALSTGHKANNGSVGVDANGNPVLSIIEILEDNGYSTGIVTTDRITGATPAAFYAHQINRYEYENIACDLMKTDIDVFIGGGRKNFDNRIDGLNLIDTILANDYHVLYNLDNVSNINSGKVAALIAEEKPPSMLDGRGNMLSIATQLALKILSNNPKGFFLMIEGAQIDWACHDNDQNYMIAEMLDFNKAIGLALDFAEQNGNTLIVITADHETGGFCLIDGDLTLNTIEGAFASDEHTAVMVPVFAFGPGAENFIGVYENTEIFYKFINQSNISSN